MNDNDLKENAIKYARKNKKRIVREVVDRDIYTEEDNPVSVFMAGSPGAGKTEASRNLIEDEKFRKEQYSVLRIDPDELRDYFSCVGYTGSNSHVFQPAVSIIVDAIHDRVLKEKKSFILDGTLSHLEKAEKNIKRSLNKGRFVQIYYVYQDPLQAWKFVLEREKKEGRRIQKDDFIDEYFGARDTVNALKKTFGKRINMDLLVKNIDGTDRYYRKNIDTVDNYIPEIYSRDTLTTAI